MLVKKVTVFFTFAACILAVPAAARPGARLVGEPMKRVTQEPVRTQEPEVIVDATTSAVTKQCIDPLTVTHPNISEQSSYEALIEQVESSAGFSLVRNERCPNSGLTYHINEEINKRSMCTWSNVRDQGNADRIPEFLYHAVCNCTNCQMAGEGSAVCRPVIKPMQVLYRGECVDGVYKYIKKSEQVSVACICSHSSDV